MIGTTVDPQINLLSKGSMREICFISGSFFSVLNESDCSG